MTMRVKLDEDLSPLVADPLRQAGYDCATVYEQGWGGLNDFELWPHIAAEGAYFVTADKGFGDVRAFAPGTHPGILILRPDRESILEFQSLVARVVEKHGLEALAGFTTVVTNRRVRIRRNPTKGHQA